MAIPVKVAIRCRPLNNKETEEGGQPCVDFPSQGSSICLRKKMFSFNYVFPPEVSQASLYEEAVKPLIKDLFLGYNATVLAYGQTGSGKTYTMGGAYDINIPQETRGIIPRVLTDIFAEFSTRDVQFTAGVSYLEIYNEEIKDLLSQQKEQLFIREDYAGYIMVTGLTEVCVKDFGSTMDCLTKGSTVRSTGSTAMNTQSSRSHAIFTLAFTIISKTDITDVRKAKFHLVDLAGSERIKKTMAEGDRLKEGININKGLLSLGNVISALSSEGGKRSHVPYRDSKLTRILQDSLGGNSYTLMIACISPADLNLDESVNTLKYAERASHIKNKPTINRDKREVEIQELKLSVANLRAELIRVTGGGGRSDCEDYQTLVEKLNLKKEQNSVLNEELRLSIEREADLVNKAFEVESSRDNLQECLNYILGNLNHFFDNESEEDQLKEDQLKEAYMTVKEKMNKANLSLENVEDRNMEQEEDDIEDTSLTHIMKQAALGKELKEINEVLNKKMNLVRQMNNSDENIELLKNQYQASMDKLESKIESLQSERDMLKTELNTKSKAGNKSEMQHQKMKKLEEEINRLKDKMAEYTYLRKLKEIADSKVKALDQDIQILKTNKVNLVKKMKKETDVYRSWKKTKDLEVNKLQQTDRKRQCEIQKLKSAQEKQQIILKRKSEEAAVANKRLKEALKKQAFVRNERANNFERYDAGVSATKLKALLEQELEVKVRLHEAKYHLVNLVEDRKIFTLELKQLMDSHKRPIKKHIATANDGSPKEVNVEIKRLTDGINDRNAQILTLQTDLQEAENDKCKGCIDTLRSMNDSKVLLNFLIERYIKKRVDRNIEKGSTKEMATELQNILKELDSMKAEMKSLKNQHELNIVDIEQKYENKISLLLKQLKEKAVENEPSIENEPSALTKEAKSIYFVLDTPNVNDPDYAPDSSTEFDTPYVKVAKKQGKTALKGCKCARSQCNSRICSCFKKISFCVASCTCLDCKNKPTSLFDDSLCADDSTS